MHRLFIGLVMFSIWTGMTAAAFAQSGLSMPMRRVDIGNLQVVQHNVWAWARDAVNNSFNGPFSDIQAHNVRAESTGSAYASTPGASATSIVMTSAWATTAQGASTFLVNDTCDVGGFDICDADQFSLADTGWFGVARSQGTYEVEAPPQSTGVTSGTATISIDISIGNWYGANEEFLRVEVGSSLVWVRAIGTGWRVTGFLADANGSGTVLFAEYGTNLTGLHYTATERFFVGDQFNVDSWVDVAAGSAGNVSRIPDYSTSFGVALYSD